MRKTAKYKCKYCGKIVKRKFNKDQFVKMWIKSWCDKEQKDVHLYKVN